MYRRIEITMPFDKTRLDDFMNDYHPRILRWCACRCHADYFMVDVLLHSVIKLLLECIQDCQYRITMLRHQLDNMRSAEHNTYLYYWKNQILMG